MKIYRIAFNLDIVKDIIKGLDLTGFQRVDDINNLARGWSAEASLYYEGEYYVDVSYSHWENQFIVEKYYESEFLNDSYGSSFKIPINFDNTEQTVSIVNSKIRALIK